jgi:hypothetical protein
VIPVAAPASGASSRDGRITGPILASRGFKVQLRRSPMVFYENPVFTAPNGLATIRLTQPHSPLVTSYSIGRRDMADIRLGFRYAQWALESMILPPLCILLPLAVVSLVWAWRRQQPMKRQLWRPVHWLALSHLLFFAAVILVGTLYPAEGSPYHGSPPTIHHGAEAALNVLFYGSLISCAFWIWRMRGFRWFAASVMAVIECPIVGALFIAGMSVTGDWL